MIEIQDPLTPRRGDVQLLVEDLACVSGTISEIMTAWRRAWPGRPELQSGLLTQIQDTARQLAGDIEAAGGAGRRRDLALSVAERFSALKDAIAGARAMTCGLGIAEAGDRELWELLSAAVDRAGTHLTALTTATG